MPDQERRTITRIAEFIKSLILDGYINKESFINKMQNNAGDSISESTFKRTKNDVENYFGIPLLYKKREKRYIIDSEKSKQKKEIKENFLDIYENKFKTLLSDHELLFFYSFIKSMINSEIYLPPLNSAANTDYENVLRIIEKILPIEKRDLAEKIEYKMSEHYKTKRKVNFTDHIKQIINSFETKKLISFTYKSSSTKKEKKHTVEPIKLLHYTAKWYLVAYNEQWNMTLMYNLSYIQNNIKLSSTDKYCYNYDEPTYNDSYGIMMSDEVETAQIRFYKPLNERMDEIIWQNDQKTSTGTDDKKGEFVQFDFNYPVIKNSMDELVGRILRYGSFVEIIKPKELRDKWIEEIKKMSKLYPK